MNEYLVVKESDLENKEYNPDGYCPYINNNRACFHTALNDGNISKARRYSCEKLALDKAISLTETTRLTYIVLKAIKKISTKADVTVTEIR